MPVSIFTSLMIWSTLLAPSSRFEPSQGVIEDRALVRLVKVDPTTSIVAWPVQEPGSWTLPDADTEEEESGDGDPEALASDAPWLSLHLFRQGQFSTIRPDRGIVPHAARSKILRC